MLFFFRPAESSSPSPSRILSLPDPRTELSDAEMRESRRNYVTEMARQRQQIELKGAEKNSSDTARQLLFGAPLDLSEAPVLIEFWNSSVGARLKELDEKV